jgi:hypothetical protein
MASTPKPIREKQKKTMAMQKAHRASEGKIMTKEQEKAHIKHAVKSKGGSKHVANMIKRSIPHTNEYKKEDLAAAHKHMKKYSRK